MKQPKQEESPNDLKSINEIMEALRELAKQRLVGIDADEKHAKYSMEFEDSDALRRRLATYKEEYLDERRRLGDWNERIRERFPFLECDDRKDCKDLEHNEKARVNCEGCVAFFRVIRSFLHEANEYVRLKKGTPIEELYPPQMVELIRELEKQEEQITDEAEHREKRRKRATRLAMGNAVTFYQALTELADVKAGKIDLSDSYILAQIQGSLKQYHVNREKMELHTEEADRGVMLEWSSAARRQINKAEKQLGFPRDYIAKVVSYLNYHQEMRISTERKEAGEDNEQRKFRAALKYVNKAEFELGFPKNYIIEALDRIAADRDLAIQTLVGASVVNKTNRYLNSLIDEFRAVGPGSGAIDWHQGKIPRDSKAYRRSLNAAAIRGIAPFVPEQLKERFATIAKLLTAVGYEGVTRQSVKSALETEEEKDRKKQKKEQKQKEEAAKEKEAADLARKFSPPQST